MTKKNAASSVEPAADLGEVPELTEEWFADAETFKGDTFVKRGRGRPPGPTGNAKELISVRLSRDVVAKLREAGPGWQSRVDGLLRGALGLEAPAEQAGRKPSLMRHLSDKMREIDKGGIVPAAPVRHPPKAV